MTMIKEYNGAISLRDVLESNRLLEDIMYELHNDEIDRANESRRKSEGESIISSMRGR